MTGFFEWDERKSEATRRARGFDFDYAARIFDGPVRERDDERQEYGERRIQAIGRIDDDMFFVVYTWRGEARQIISARFAKEKEKDEYRKIYG